MAIFSSSVVVGSVSGNAGGTCFVNSRGSKVLRKTRRASSITDDNIRKQQSIFANFSRLWRSLTVDEQNAWRTYANNFPRSNRLGLLRPISGYQEFMSSRIFHKGEIPFSDNLPPTIADNPITANYKFNSSVANGIELIMGNGPVAGDISVTLYGFLSYSTSLVASFNRHTLLGTFTVAQGVTLDITSDWLEVFPHPVLDQVIGFKGFYFKSGSRARSAIFQILKTVSGAPVIIEENWSPTQTTGTATGVASNVNMLRGNPGQDTLYVSYTDAETKVYKTMDNIGGASQMNSGSIITHVDMELRGDTDKNDDFDFELWINLGAGLVKVGATKNFSDSSSGFVYKDINFSDASWDGLAWTKAQWDTVEIRSVFSEGQGGEGRMTVINLEVTFNQ